MVIRKEITDFLSVTPPFNLLEQKTLDIIADKISIEFYPRGQKILSQNGVPCSELRIIKKGGVKVYVTNDEGDDIIIDYRSEGDSFGFISLISGDKSRAHVIAIEDTICYLVPKSVVQHIVSEVPLVGEYFMKSFFLNFIDKTYSEMRQKSFVFGEGDKLLYTTMVKDLLAKNAVTAPSGIAVRDAAAEMSKHRISSLIIVDKLQVPVGIITDRDLRDKVVARGLDTSRPVDEIMSPPFIRVDAHETCFEALVKMVQYNIHHLLVIEEGQLKGVITNHDFMLLQGTSPLSLVKYIEGQKHVEGLLPIHEKINHIISILFKEGVRTANIMRIVTELNDRLLQKIIDLSLKETGTAPESFAFIVYGSDGRKEQTFKTDFNCALVFDDPKTPNEKTETEEFFRKLLNHIQGIFTKCGLPRFNPHPFGKELPLYGSISSWVDTFIPALRSNRETVALNARKLLDLRLIYGDGTLVKTLRSQLYKKTNENRTFIAAFLDWAHSQSSPLGFFKQFVVDRSGEHKDKIDIKEKGILQIVDALRVLAVGFDIQETSTFERLNALSKTSDIMGDLSDDIASAFEFLLHLRLQHQLGKRDFHEEIDDFIEPDKLSLLEKKTLKEIFQLIPRLHTVVEDYYQKRETIAI